MSEKSFKKNIDLPVQKTELAVFGDEYVSMKEKFQHMMKNLDHEMMKFSSYLRDHERSSSAHSEVSVNPSVTTYWGNIIASPLIQDDGVAKTLKLQFDVSNFSPEEIVVQIASHTLLVSAKHEEHNENNTEFREYNRKFVLPRGIDVDSIISTLSKEGVLTVEAPLPTLPMDDDDDVSN